MDIADSSKKKLLNVGGGSKNISLPDYYDEWASAVLDIDPLVCPDIVCDARDLMNQANYVNSFDVVYCSHNLEHYYHHDIPSVLIGFKHVLKDGGAIHIRVPDLMGLMRRVVERNMDVDDVIYTAPIGAVRVRDVIYGYAPQIKKSGNDFYAHKTGFSCKSLVKLLNKNGLKYVYTQCSNLEIIALAFEVKPSEGFLKLYGLESNSDLANCAEDVPAP